MGGGSGVGTTPMEGGGGVVWGQFHWTRVRRGGGEWCRDDSNGGGGGVMWGQFHWTRVRGGGVV